MNYWFIGDTHHGDRDQWTDGLRDFLGWTANQGDKVICLGDWLDWSSIPAYHMRRFQDVLRWDLVEVVTGNHDWYCWGLGLLGYRQFNGNPGPDQWRFGDGRALGVHGHGADPIWTDERRRGKARRWAGEKLLQFGYLYDDPSEWLLKAGKWIYSRVIPRGWQSLDSDEHLIDYACKLAWKYDAEIVATGHTHRPGVWKRPVDASTTDETACRPILIFNLGAWVPAHEERVVPGIKPMDHYHEKGKPNSVFGYPHIVKAGAIPSFTLRVGDDGTISFHRWTVNGLSPNLMEV